MLDATKHENVQFINAARKVNHDLLRTMNNYMDTLFRNKNIINYSTNMFDNNLLHLSAHLGPFSDLNHKYGVTLQMQREIQ